MMLAAPGASGASIYTKLYTPGAKTGRRPPAVGRSRLSYNQDKRRHPSTGVFTCQVFNSASKGTAPALLGTSNQGKASKLHTCFTYYNPGRTLEDAAPAGQLDVKNFSPAPIFSKFNYTYYRDRTNDGTHTNNNNQNILHYGKKSMAQ